MKNLVPKSAKNVISYGFLGHGLGCIRVRRQAQNTYFDVFFVKWIVAQWNCARTNPDQSANICTGMLRGIQFHMEKDFLKENLRIFKNENQLRYEKSFIVIRCAK